MKKLLLYVLLIFSVMTSFGYAEDVVEEFPWGKVKLIFDPSPDTRVTGYNVYWLNTVTNIEQKRNLLNQTSTEYIKDDFIPEVIYKFTATAYATINGKFHESVRSGSLFVKFIEPVIPITKPGAPKLIRLEY